MANVRKYDEAMKQHPAFYPLYAMWLKRVRGNSCPEFTDFVYFFKWAVENGYDDRGHLVLIDGDKPYSPSNCLWKRAKGRDRKFIMPEEEAREWVRKWNSIVNRIRKHYGMEPLPGTGGR